MEKIMNLIPQSAGIGACMDVKSHKGLLYAIQRYDQVTGGRLCVLRPDLSLAATFPGIGNARQIEILEDLAVITAREDGLWLFDISQPRPRLLSHFRTVEYATGIALWKRYAFVSCRQYGVQILDISNPTAPRHISFVRVGEVQSATVSEGILYCGVWGEMKVVAVDVHDPTYPRVLYELPLQGRGDGVCVKDGILYAATGQHARGIINNSDPTDPAFGKGNGVECFDVSNPAAPKKIAGTRFEVAYCSAVDMWEPAFYGDTLVVNNSVLGVYLLDKDLHVKDRLPVVTEGGAVGGVTVLDRDLYVATVYGQLYVYRGMGPGDPVPNLGGDDGAVPSQPFMQEGEGGNATVLYSGSFPVMAADQTDTLLPLACCEDGVHVLDKATLSLVYKIQTRGQAQDVRTFGSTLYVAEGAQGVGVYSLQGKTPVEIGRYVCEKGIYQIAVSHKGHFLTVACGSDEVRMLSVSDPASIGEIYRHSVTNGPLYGNNLASTTLDDGTMILFWHKNGLCYTNPEQGDDRFHFVSYAKKRGFCGYCNGEGIESDGKRIFYSHKGAYSLLDVNDPDGTFLEDKPQGTVCPSFRGLLSLQGNRMVATQRSTGEIRALDIANAESPTVLSHVKTNASPAKAIFCGNRILIPGGRSGLLELKIQ